MSNTPELDRAIRAYNKVYDVPDDWPIRDADRDAFKAGVAELLRGMTPETVGLVSPPAWKGFNSALAEIRRRAGILEGEG